MVQLHDYHCNAYRDYKYNCHGMSVVKRSLRAGVVQGNISSEQDVIDDVNRLQGYLEDYKKILIETFNQHKQCDHQYPNSSYKLDLDLFGCFVYKYTRQCVKCCKIENITITDESLDKPEWTTSAVYIS